MDLIRKAWNDRHKELHHALEKTGDDKLVRELFLTQHAAVHSAHISEAHVPSFSDEILGDLAADEWRFIPSDNHHSIAWVIWHLARVEDVTMNLLVAGSDQVLRAGNWNERLGIHDVHTGNGVTDEDIAVLSKAIDIQALVEYRDVVGRETRGIVKKLKITDFQESVDPKRIQRIWDERAMLKNATGIVDYWANRTIAGLLLMPPTRHCILHLNEARRLKESVRKSKK